MRKFTTLLLLSFVLITATKSQTLLHYWNFNSYVSTTTAIGDPSLIVPIPSDYSLVTSPAAKFSYQIQKGVSSAYQSYCDVTTGDVLNARNGDPAGNCFRARDADSMQLVFNVPTTGYSSIIFSYAITRSKATAPGADTFYYSIDSGKTWTNSGCDIKFVDTLPPTTTIPGYQLIQVHINDSKAENNSKLLFKIVPGFVHIPLAGNQRFDNITVEGTKITTTPVNLISFTGAKHENEVKINWSFTNPINVNNFVIEHSTNAKEFTALNTVHFENNNQSVYNMSFTDINPVAGSNYYRLKTVDANGEFTYSNVISVQNKSSVKVTVSPNPAKNILHVAHNLVSLNNITATVYSLDGKKIRTSIVKSQTNFDMNIADLLTGTYLLVLENESDKEATQFIKK